MRPDCCSQRPRSEPAVPTEFAGIGEVGLAGTGEAGVCGTQVVADLVRPPTASLCRSVPLHRRTPHAELGLALPGRPPRQRLRSWLIQRCLRLRRGVPAVLLSGVLAAAASLHGGAIARAGAPPGSIVVSGTGDGTLAALAGNGTCDLREAIQAANTNAAVGECAAGTAALDTIVLPAAVITLSAAGAGEDANATGDLDILSGGPLAIQGAPGSTLDANNLDRVVDLQANAALTLTNTTITDGSTSGLGGGIRSFGALTVSASTISSNDATNGGAGIYAIGALTLRASTISGNQSLANGGAIYTYGVGTTVEISNSTLSGNVAAGYGGGLFHYGGTTTVTNSTITANAGSEGGGIYRSAGSLTLRNTIIAGNTASNAAPDIFGNVTGDASNLIGTTAGALGTVGTGSDIVNPAAGLGPLASNGGPTQTHTLLAGSPALNAGSSAICAAAPVSGLDQRGLARPQGPGCEIGALELSLAEIEVLDGPTSIADGSGIVNLGSTTVGAPIQHTLTIRNAGTGPLALGAPALPAGFSLVGSAPASIPAGGSATLTLQLDATLAGSFSGEVIFTTNDGDENPFSFIISGTVTVAPAVSYRVSLPLVDRPDSS